LRLKRFAESEAQYRHIIQRQPMGLYPPLNLAESLVAQGKVAEALAILQVQALRSPDNPHVLLLLGNAYVEAGQFQDALAMLGLGASLSSLGDHASALKWFERALAEYSTCLDDDAELRDLFNQSRHALSTVKTKH
jgi:predicted Zn-dependent protease